jgi:Replication initiator protein A
VVEGIEKQKRMPERVAKGPADWDSFADGRDEMNLIECPLSAVADRYLDGRKTVVFCDEVFDTDRGSMVKRELAISGSDRYGLPTARDEDVLLACVQLAAIQNFQSRDVHFSRYELMKLLRWPDEGKSYTRLATSLRRWKGVTLYSDRAFYDHARKSWVTRDFGVFDFLSLYERESTQGVSAPAASRFVWNEVFFNSFQSGYLKKLDWILYCQLHDPVAKRLYRLLDKRFYRTNEVTFDLRELAIRKVRLSDTYDTAQIKRALNNGIRELEAVWELNPLPVEQRYRRVKRGEWKVVFTRKQAQPKSSRMEKPRGQEAELVKRGVAASTASNLVRNHSVDQIGTAVELFDWYAKANHARGPGFLVDAIRHPDKYRHPPGFVASHTRRQRQAAAESRKRAERELQEQRQAKAQRDDESRWQAFTVVWDRLPKSEQRAFEQTALASASPTKRDGYLRLACLGGSVFEHYRRIVLLDHFDRTHAPS